MGIFFQKRISLGKHLKMNLSKNGVGFSTGIKGLSVSTGPKGNYMNASIPGTGIRFREKIGTPPVADDGGSRDGIGCFGWIWMVFFGISFIFGIITNWQTWEEGYLEIAFYLLLVTLIPLFLLAIRRTVKRIKDSIKERKLLELGVMPFIPMSEARYGKLYDEFGVPLEKSFERYCREIMSGKRNDLLRYYIKPFYIMKECGMVVSLDGTDYPKVCQDEFEKWLESLHHNGDLMDSDTENIKLFGNKIERIAKEIKKPEKKLSEVAMLIYKGAGIDDVKKYFRWSRSRTEDAVRQLMDLGIIGGEKLTPCVLKESVYKEIVKIACCSLGIDFFEPIED